MSPSLLLGSALASQPVTLSVPRHQFTLASAEDTASAGGEPADVDLARIERRMNAAHTAFGVGGIATLTGTGLAVAGLVRIYMGVISGALDPDDDGSTAAKGLGMYLGGGAMMGLGLTTMVVSSGVATVGLKQAGIHVTWVPSYIALG